MFAPAYTLKAMPNHPLFSVPATYTFNPRAASLVDARAASLVDTRAASLTSTLARQGRLVRHDTTPYGSREEAANGAHRASVLGLVVVAAWWNFTNWGLVHVIAGEVFATL